MATAQSLHLLRGKIGQQIFRVVNGKQQVYAAPGQTKHKSHTWKRPGYNPYRRNIEEFAAAAHIGGAIYRHIRPATNTKRHPEAIGRVLRPYSHNIIVARLKEFAEYAYKISRKADHPIVQPNSYAREFLVRDAYRALEGLNLSHKGAPEHHVHMTPIGPRHNPDAIKITGLHHAAQAIPVHGNAQLEFRITIRQSRFDEMRYNESAKKFKRIPLPEAVPQHPFNDRQTNWIPAEIIPTEGMTIPVPKWAEHEKYVTAIIIEWREIRPVGNKTIRHDKLAIVRIASVHAPADAFDTQEEAHIQACLTKIHLANQPAPPAQNWQKDPRKFLQDSLNQLRT